ncbi:MAG: Co2+/Mg2+ efflux protein ApaG [Mariprofundaceae bacterium]|nr:Co2+/Mg2+ efflux protein ApaG [Mariprofundaceae bacterium]
MSDACRIKVSVLPEYLPEQSEPDTGQYLFAYHITITNTGTMAAQLISRRWLITDANEQVEEVTGEGVVGNQPWISPGNSFEYSSFCILDTPVGTMQGSYQMVAEDGTTFEADIHEFMLAVPGVLN